MEALVLSVAAEVTGHSVDAQELRGWPFSLEDSGKGDESEVRVWVLAGSSVLFCLFLVNRMFLEV